MRLYSAYTSVLLLLTISKASSEEVYRYQMTPNVKLRTATHHLQKKPHCLICIPEKFKSTEMFCASVE